MLNWVMIPNSCSREISFSTFSLRLYATGLALKYLGQPKDTQIVKVWYFEVYPVYSSLFYICQEVLRVIEFVKGMNTVPV